MSRLLIAVALCAAACGLLATAAEQEAAVSTHRDAYFKELDYKQLDDSASLLGSRDDYDEMRDEDKYRYHTNTPEYYDKYRGGRDRDRDREYTDEYHTYEHKEHHCLDDGEYCDHGKCCKGLRCGRLQYVEDGDVKWTNDRPLCYEPVPCKGNPSPNPANGAFLCGAHTASGTPCEAICNKGYTGYPAFPQALCSMGCWGPPTGTCVLDCKAPGELCRATDFDCCNGQCVGGRCGQVCFSGDTRVRILESDTPVAMRDVKTGQHVQCLNTNEDLRLPTTASYCKVMNWLHADERSILQIRITFTQPNGVDASITVSGTHLMLKLIDAGAGTTARSVDLFGAFDTIAAYTVAPGDKLAVLTNENDPSAGFTVVAATSVEQVQANGMYVPMIATPYIIADGVVTPLYVAYSGLLHVQPGTYGAWPALAHLAMSPLFMKHLQEVGTPGTQGQWSGVPLNKAGMWPGSDQIQAAGAHHARAKKALNFEALRAALMPRIAAWRANSTRAAAVTVEDVMNVFKAEDVWV